MIKFVLLGLIFILTSSRSISFVHSIPAHQHYCYYQSFQQHSKFTLEIEPLNDTIYEFSVAISMEFIDPYFKKETTFGKQKIKLSRMAPTTNRYTICTLNKGDNEVFFKLKLAQGAQVMDFSVGFSKNDYNNLVKDFERINNLSRSINSSVSDISVSKSLASDIYNGMLQRSFVICAISIILLLGTNTIIFKSLKDIISKRKLI